MKNIYAAAMLVALSAPLSITFADAPDGEISPDEITMDVVPTGSPASIVRDKEESRASFAGTADRPDAGAVERPEVEAPVIETPDVEPPEAVSSPEPEKKRCKRRS